MANRQALRELQSRLASRLQAARDEGPSVAWLAVEAQATGYLFPLGQAGEIFAWTAVQPVPYTRPWFLGVANLRGNLAGVVDFAAFLASAGPAPQAASPPTARRTDTPRADASLVTFNAALGVQCALAVDRLAGLRGGEAFVAVAPRAADAPAWHGSAYTDAQQRRWQEIDLPLLAEDPRFLDITLGLEG
ncbi:chemotaxis protein CheW [Xylophilus sp. Kf1]|nr:chemotaxis protein CheW [Xylophilus sp. Kf1]